jgi:hypothetical protein
MVRVAKLATLAYYIICHKIPYLLKLRRFNLLFEWR